MRYANKLAIFEHLKERPKTGMTEIELMQKTGLSKPSVIACLKELKSEDTIKSKKGEGDLRGRRPLFFYPVFEFVSGISVTPNDIKRLFKRNGITDWSFLE